MGPADEPGPGGRAARAVVLYQGAEVPAYLDQPPVVGSVAAGFAGGAGRHSPGDRIVLGRRHARSTPGSSSTSRSASRPNREIAVSGLLRDGREVGLRRHAAESPTEPIRDRRHRRAARRSIRTCDRSPPASRPTRPGSSRATSSLAVERRADDASRGSCRTRSASRPDSRSSLVDRARGPDARR